MFQLKLYFQDFPFDMPKVQLNHISNRQRTERATSNKTSIRWKTERNRRNVWGCSLSVCSVSSGFYIRLHFNAFGSTGTSCERWVVICGTSLSPFNPHWQCHSSVTSPWKQRCPGLVTGSQRLNGDEWAGAEDTLRRNKPPHSLTAGRTGFSSDVQTTYTESLSTKRRELLTKNLLVLRFSCPVLVHTVKFSTDFFKNVFLTGQLIKMLFSWSVISVHGSNFILIFTYKSSLCHVNAVYLLAGLSLWNHIINLKSLKVKQEKIKRQKLSLLICQRLRAPTCMFRILIVSSYFLVIVEKQKDSESSPWAAWYTTRVQINLWIHIHHNESNAANTVGIFPSTGYFWC